MKKTVENSKNITKILQKTYKKIQKN